MKMQVNSRVWNLGDTSFRRKQLLDDYLELLKVLRNLNKVHTDWNKDTQKEFHIMVLRETELLDKNNIPKNLDRRARTMTNALNKVGLCDKNRNLTQVGLDLLKLEKAESFEKDDLENKINISSKNILFLRQMLKFRIFNSTEDENFNPFLIILAFLTEYDYLEENHFKQIVQNLYFCQDYKKMVQEYQYVKTKRITFEEYIRDNLLKDLEDLEEDGDSERILLQFQKNGKHFKEIFKNRKTPTSVKLYEEFYEALNSVRKDIKNKINNEKNIKALLQLARDSKIIKAFMSNEIFNIPRPSGKEAIEFLNDNKDNDLFMYTDEQFRKKLHSIFILAKNNDLIGEYYDVTVRTFNLTGVLDFSNGRVKLSKRYLMDLIKDNKDKLFNLIEQHKYKDIKEYEDDFYNNKMKTLEILDINSRQLEEHNKKIMKETDISNIEEFDRYYLNLEEKEFINFTNNKFSNQDLIDILENIRERNDSLVYKQVTDNANIPTIFEYIIGIAWYRISSSYEKYNVLNSLNLSLDGTFLPLSHAVGGDGDIVIDYKNHILMLEVTLMDLSNQRRNELEPVIRHATNLTISNPDKPVYTLFVANEIDYNVSSIFRVCSFINLKSTTGSGKLTTDGVQISSLEISEIVTLLENNISYKTLYDDLQDEFKDDKRDIVKSDWREKLVAKII